MSADGKRIFLSRRSAVHARLERARIAAGAALAAILGAAPHVLHHAGPLAGAALLGGTAGSVLFGALGFLLAVPFLVHLKHRSGSWRVPLLALGVMLAAFAISTLLVGPALTADDRSDGAPATAPAHESHHGD